MDNDKTLQDLKILVGEFNLLEKELIEENTPPKPKRGRPKKGEVSIIKFKSYRKPGRPRNPAYYDEDNNISFKKYYEINKDKLKERQKKLVTCDICYSVVTYGRLAGHKTTTKCKKLYQRLVKNTELENEPIPE